RETSDLIVSYWFAQAEDAGFEIQDPATGVSAFYEYVGAGFALSPPGIWPLKAAGGASTAGSWNDFTAPGYMEVDDFSGHASIQTPVSVGFGSSTSYNILEINAATSDFGADVLISNFSTGNTWGLPSSGYTSGRLRLVGSSAAPTKTKKVP